MNLKRMTEEIKNLQQNTLEKEERYERQLEEMKTQLTVQISLNLELSTGLTVLKEAEVPEEKPCEQESIATVSAPKLLEVTKVSKEKACEQDSIATTLALEPLDVTQVSKETNQGKTKKVFVVSELSSSKVSACSLIIKEFCGGKAGWNDKSLLKQISSPAS